MVQDQCHVCDNDAATLQCTTCEELQLTASLYCNDCSDQFHTKHPEHNIIELEQPKLNRAISHQTTVQYDTEPQHDIQTIMEQTDTFNVQETNEDNDVTQKLANAFDALSNVIDHPIDAIKHVTEQIEHTITSVTHTRDAVSETTQVEHRVEHTETTDTSNAASEITPVVQGESKKSESGFMSKLKHAANRFANTVRRREHKSTDKVDTDAHQVSDTVRITVTTEHSVEQNKENTIQETIESHEPALTRQLSTKQQNTLRSLIKHQDSKDELIDLTKLSSRQYKDVNNALYEFGTYQSKQPTPNLTRQHTPVLPRILSTQIQSQTITPVTSIPQPSDSKLAPLTNINNSKSTFETSQPLQPQNQAPLNQSLSTLQSVSVQQSLVVQPSQISNTQSIDIEPANTTISPQQHNNVPVQPAGPFCIVCEATPATIYCTDCDLILCTTNDECDQHIHSDVRHTRIPITQYTTQQHKHTITSQPHDIQHNDLCVMCETAPAQVYCQQCELYLCTDNYCDRDLHCNDLMYHTRNPLPKQSTAVITHDICIDTTANVATVQCDICQHSVAVVQCNTCSHTTCAICDIHLHIHTTQHNRIHMNTQQPVFQSPIVEPVQPTVTQPTYEPLQLNVYSDTLHIQPNNEVLSDNEVEPADIVTDVVIDTEHQCDECHEHSDIYCYDCKKYYCNGSVQGNNCNLDTHFATAMRSHKRKQIRTVHTVNDNTHTQSIDTAAESARLQQAQQYSAAQLKQQKHARKQELLREKQQQAHLLAVQQAAAEQKLLATKNERQQQYDQILQGFQQKLNEMEVQKQITENRLLEQLTQQNTTTVTTTETESTQLATQQAELDRLSADIIQHHTAIQQHKQHIHTTYEQQYYEHREAIREQMRLETERKLIELEATAVALGNTESVQRNDILLHTHRMELQAKQQLLHEQRKQRDMRIQKQQQRDIELHELNKQLLAERERIHAELTTKQQSVSYRPSTATSKRTKKQIADVPTDAEIREQKVLELRQKHRTARIKAIQQAVTQKTSNNTKTVSSEPIDTIATVSNQPVYTAVDAATRAARLKKARNALVQRRTDTKQQAETYRAQRRNTRNIQNIDTDRTEIVDSNDNTEQHDTDETDRQSDMESEYSDWEQHIATQRLHTTYDSEPDTVAEVIAQKLDSECSSESELDDTVDAVQQDIVLEPVIERKTIAIQHNTPHIDIHNLNLHQVWPALAETATALQNIGKLHKPTKQRKLQPVTAAQQQKYDALTKHRVRSNKPVLQEVTAEMHNKIQQQRTVKRQSVKPVVSAPTTTELNHGIQQCEQQLQQLKTTEQFELRKSLILQIEQKRQQLKSELQTQTQPRFTDNYLLNRYHIQNSDNAVIDSIEPTLQSNKQLQHNISTVQNLQLDRSIDVTQRAVKRPQSAKPKLMRPTRVQSSVNNNLPSFNNTTELDTTFVLRPTHSFNPTQQSAVLNKSDTLNLPEFEKLNMFDSFDISSLDVTQRRQPGTAS